MTEGGGELVSMLLTCCWEGCPLSIGVTDVTSTIGEADALSLDRNTLRYWWCRHCSRAGASKLKQAFSKKSGDFDLM